LFALFPLLLSPNTTSSVGCRGLLDAGAGNHIGNPRMAQKTPTNAVMKAIDV